MRFPTGLTPLDYFACNEYHKECKEKKECPPCWLVMNDAIKKELYDKAVVKIRAARWEFKVMTEQGLNLTICEVPQVKALYDNWVTFETEMQIERANNNPKAFFVPAYLLGLE